MTVPFFGTACSPHLAPSAVVAFQVIRDDGAQFLNMTHEALMIDPDHAADFRNIDFEASLTGIQVSNQDHERLILNPAVGLLSA